MSVNANLSQADMLVSVVIPAPADPGRVSRCLEKVLEQTWSNREVVLVCDEDTPVFAPDQEPVRVVGENRGENMAALLNRGIEAAEGDIIVVLMPNCFPADRRWMEGLVRPFEDPDVGAVVSQCEAHDTPNLNLPARLMESVESPELTDGGEPRELHLLSQLCDAFRAEILRELDHAYDESLQTAGEGVDMSFRIGARGHKIVLSPTAGVRYLAPPTTRSMGSVFRTALDYGRADAALGKAHNIDWLGSRMFGAAAISLALIPVGLFSLPIALIVAGLLFAWGWFLPLRLPVVKWEWPVAVLNVAVYAAIVLSIRDHWAPEIFPPRRWHPAIIRQWSVLGGMAGSYLLILFHSAAVSAVRSITDLRSVLSAPAILVLSVGWYFVSGIGYLLGYVASSPPGRSDEN